MGLVCSALSACSCCMSSCQCCLSAFRCGRTSTRARAQYFTMWVVFAFVAWILRDHGYDALKHVGDMKNCADDTCTGNGMVLRITLAMVLLSSVMAILVLGVESSSQARAAIQNDFFTLKWLALMALIIACIFIDNKTIINYAYASSVCSGFFMLAGIILMLEFAHQWNDDWVERYDGGENKIWAYMIVLAAFLLFGGSIVVWVVLLQYYGGPGCNHTNAFVSVTIVLSVIVSITGALKVVNQGILPSAVMVAYCTYLVASAVIDIPTSDSSSCAARHTKVATSTSEGVYSVGVIFTILCIGYCTIRHASRGQDLTPTKAPSKAAAASGDEPEVAAAATDDETTATEYNYAFFHVVYAVGAMYLGMVLINWDISLQEEDRSLGSHSTWISVYVKMGAQWCTFVLYFWSLVAPLVLSDRDFS